MRTLRRNSHQIAQGLRSKERWSPAIRTLVARLDLGGELSKELDEHEACYPLRINGQLYDRDGRRVDG